MYQKLTVVVPSVYYVNFLGVYIISICQDRLPRLIWTEYLGGL